MISWFLKRRKKVSVFDLIRRLQQKPKSTRQKIALSVSFGITLIIAGIWVAVIFGGDDPVFTTQQRAENEAAASSPSPFDALKNNASRAYERMKGEFDSDSDVTTQPVGTSTQKDAPLHRERRSYRNDSATSSTHTSSSTAERMSTSTATPSTDQSSGTSTSE